MTRTAGECAVYFDPPTHHQYENKLFDRGSNPYAGDDILAPYAAVQSRLEAAGVPVQTLDHIPPAPDGRQNIVISFGIPDRMPSHSVRKYVALSQRPDITLSALFAMECPIVEPGLFESLPVLQGHFRRLLSWSDAEALLPFTRTLVELEHFCWPQSFDQVNAAMWAREDRKFLLMMNANKLPRLGVNELYTERLRAVEYFQRFDEVDLYGRNWDKGPTRVGKTRTPYALRRVGSRFAALKQSILPDPLYVAARRAWRGAAPSKSETFSQYRFALCFENSKLKGWITEKMFDCFFAGTIPVYWGAPEILDWVPAECFVDMRDFTDYGELRSFLKGLSAGEMTHYREAARDYLASDRFDPYRIKCWVDRIAKIVADDTGMEI